MLKGIDQRLSPELVYALLLMGHGDDIVICDVNHPATSIAKSTTYGHVINFSGADMPEAITVILSLMPLDTFVPMPVVGMKVVGDSAVIPDIRQRVQKVLDESQAMPITIRYLERFDFYEAAKKSFAIVRTSDSGPYGCFILKKGVVDLQPI